MSYAEINGIYRGYLLANLTAILQLNIFLSVKHLAEGMSVGENSFVEKIVNKESLALLSCTLLLHPLDTLK